jgi:hypothetical protein
MVPVIFFLIFGVIRITATSNNLQTFYRKRTTLLGDHFPKNSNNRGMKKVATIIAEEATKNSSQILGAITAIGTRLQFIP